MEPNKKPVKITVPETGVEFTLATAELVAKVRDALLNKRRFDIAATTWAAMSEKDQRQEVDRLEAFAEELVVAVVNVVAAGGYDVIHARLDNFKVKDGAVTVMAKGIADDGALIKLNHADGKVLKIIVADEGQFDQHRDKVHVDADEPALFTEEGGEADEDEEDEEDEIVDPETGEITSAKDPAPDESPEYGGGYDSRLGGYELSANPFPKGSEKAAQWAAGWKAANAELAEKSMQEAGQAKADSAIEPAAGDATTAATNATTEAAGDALLPGEDEAEIPKGAPAATGASPSETGAAPSAPKPSYDMLDAEVTADELREINGNGYDARMDGQSPDKNPWDEATDADRHAAWNAGYDERKREENED